MKEQSWVPGMGVAFCECCQLYGAQCGLEVPCSWGWPLSPSLLVSGISLHGIHVGLFLLYKQHKPLAYLSERTPYTIFYHLWYTVIMR